jgi:predicted ATPase
VAREIELQRLHQDLADAVTGQGQVVFIAGEAGRGKSSLLFEFARQALDAHPDLIVAGGNSDLFTGAGNPLLPFRDIFRMLVSDFENTGMHGILGNQLVQRLHRALLTTVEIVMQHGPHLIDTLVPGATLEVRLAQVFTESSRGAVLLDQLHEQRARMTSLSTLELQQERLFEEVSTTLANLARHHPLLLLLDDLHWIDTATAGLMGHLASRLQHSRIMLLGSFRPEDLYGRGSSDADGPVLHPLQNVLSESRRLYGRNQIDLDHPRGGQDLRFVNALVDSESNRLGSSFRQRLSDVTEGNALFTIELLRDMKDRGDLERDSTGAWFESETLSWAHIPARVEGVIEKRIMRLPDELREVLNIASVQGESFAAEVIAAVRGVNTRQLIGLLTSDGDRRHRLVRELGLQEFGDARLSLFGFRHQLFQKYLYDQLGVAERIYLHGDVGNAVESLVLGQASERDLPAVQLARHFEQARQNEKASHYLLLAGLNAAHVVAYDEAAAHFEHGLALLGDVAPSPAVARQQYELTLALARAYWHIGRVADAISSCTASIDIARTLADAEAFGVAVLAYEEPRWRLNLAADTSQRYIREALALLGDQESGLRVRLLVSLARTLLASGERLELRQTVAQALHIARRIEDRVALCDALRIFAQIDRRPETTPARLTAIEELLETARSIPDQERLADGLDLYVYDHLELGHIDLVDRAIADQRLLAEEMKQPFQLHVAAVLQTMRAIMRGEFAEAEQLAQAAADISSQLGIAELDGILGIHMFTIRAEQGRLNEIAPLVKLYVAANPASTTWTPGLALIYAAIGDHDQCLALFSELAGDAFARLPRDSMWVTSLAYLTQACVYLGDADSAATLYELLLPYDGRAIVVGGATACYGAAARYLGMLATTMADWSAARRHFEGALTFDAQLGARPWLAHSQYETASMLLKEGDVACAHRAAALLDEALVAAREMGMGLLTEKIAGAQERNRLT